MRQQPTELRGSVTSLSIKYEYRIFFIMTFYVDSCIYLNLWQNEVSKKGQLLWKFALDFFEHIEQENNIILVSGFVVKELSFVLKEEFEKKKQLFDDTSQFKKVSASSGDYANARKLESASKFEISFFDCMHIVLSKKNNATLITRDRKLINFACNHCSVARPEEIIKTD